MALIIGPAWVQGEVSGPVRVMHGDKEVFSCGNMRDADKFARGYNVAWHCVKAEAIAAVKKI